VPKEVSAGEIGSEVAVQSNISVAELKECSEFADISDEEAEEIIKTIIEFTTIAYIHYNKKINKK